MKYTLNLTDKQHRAVLTALNLYSQKLNNRATVFGVNDEELEAQETVRELIAELNTAQGGR